MVAPGGPMRFYAQYARKTGPVVRTTFCDDYDVVAEGLRPAQRSVTEPPRLYWPGAQQTARKSVVRLDRREKTGRVEGTVLNRLSTVP